MTKYEQELNDLKPWDEVQLTSKCDFSGLDFITTAGHGYLVVPRTHKAVQVAQSIVSYGFSGKLAIYLEEDCEAGEFINLTKKELI